MMPELEKLTQKPATRANPAPDHEHFCDCCGKETRHLRVTDREGWWVCAKGCEVKS